MRLAVFSGEASGDSYASELISRIRAKASGGLDVEAVGGKRTAETGATILADSARWGAMSIVQSLVVAPRVFRGGLKASAALKKGTPGLAIFIDFGYLNVRLARIARDAGWRTLYFIPPGSWRRDKQGADIPIVSNRVVTPFQWSADLLRSMGAQVDFFGHPLKQLVADSAPPSPSMRTGIAILPGSRWHEVGLNLPVIAGAMQSFPNMPVEFAVAQSIDPTELARRWEVLSPGRRADKFTASDRYGVLRRAQAAIVCSGTATLEAALCRTPMVVIYRLSKAMEVEARLLRLRPKFAALPNILLDRRAVPELLQQDASPSGIAAELRKLVGAGPEREAQLSAFDEIDAMLGASDALDRTADLAVEMLADTV